VEDVFAFVGIVPSMLWLYSIEMYIAEKLHVYTMSRA
jgi:hypothetical protein